MLKGCVFSLLNDACYWLLHVVQILGIEIHLLFFFFCLETLFTLFILLIVVFYLFCSAADWKFAAEEFAKRLPDKVFVHCK